MLCAFFHCETKESPKRWELFLECLLLCDPSEGNFWNVYCSVTHPRGIQEKKNTQTTKPITVRLQLEAFSLVEFYSVFKDGQHLGSICKNMHQKYSSKQFINVIVINFLHLKKGDIQFFQPYPLKFRRFQKFI